MQPSLRTTANARKDFPSDCMLVAMASGWHEKAISARHIAALTLLNHPQ